MNTKQMTVKDLKLALKGLPDDLPLWSAELQRGGFLTQESVTGVEEHSDSVEIVLGSIQ